MHRPKPAPAPPVGPEVFFVASRRTATGAPPDPDDPRRDDEAMFRRIISNLGVGVLLVDLEGRIRVCNPAALRLLGLREDQVVGRAPLEQSWAVVHEDGTRFRVDELPEMIAIREGRPVLGVMMGVDRPGTPDRVWVLMDAIPHLDASRRVTEVVCSFSDMTDRRRAEDALLAAEEQLRQALKMEAIGRLAGGVAHDFNNLLTAILGYSDLMISRMSDDDPRRHEAEEIRRAAQRAGALTRQLLAFSRKQVLAPRVLDLPTLVDQLHPMLRRLIGEDIALTVVADPGAPPLRADAAQLEQVVMNLVLNARDAMPEGGRLRITTGTEKLSAAQAASWGLSPGRYVRLTVTDTGQGMDEETRARIFDPFFTTKEEGKGTGLGLSTVYGIIRQSGGGIRVDSEPRRGSTFVVLLPAVSDVEDAPRRSSGALHARGNESVLLVEDESAVRRLADEILTQAGFRVMATSDPESALQFVSASEDDIDLLVTDVVMPGMNGRQLADLVRIARPSIRTLFVSGYLDDPRLASEPGRPMSLLQKPFTPEMLLQRIRETLDAPLPVAH